MKNRQITQKVIDFQFSRIKMKDQIKPPYYLSRQKTSKNKLQQWNLNNIVAGLGLSQKNKYSIKWVGYDNLSYLHAFIYCLFKGSINNLAEQNGIYVKLKHHIYELANRYLKLAQQKNLVQSLCTIQFTKNLSQYFNKNSSIYNLFNKLLKGLLQQSKCQKKTQLQVLKTFSKVFSFIKFQVINQFIGLFQHYQQRYFIIYQKQCYFIVEEIQTQRTVQLNKIQQFQNESQHQKKLLYESKLTHNNQQIQTLNKNRDNLNRKSFEYIAPKFILKTQKNINQNRHSEGKSDIALKKNKIQTKKYLTINQLQKNGQFRNTMNNAGTSLSILQLKGQINTLSKQNLTTRRKNYYKQQKKRTKTSVLKKKQRTNSKSPQMTKSNYINAEQKQMIKANFKKVELSLKKITTKFHKQKQLKCQRNSYTILPRQQSFKKIGTKCRSTLTNPRHQLKSFTNLQ